MCRRPLLPTWWIPLPRKPVTRSEATPAGNRRSPHSCSSARRRFCLLPPRRRYYWLVALLCTEETGQKEGGLAVIRPIAEGGRSPSPKFTVLSRIGAREWLSP